MPIAAHEWKTLETRVLHGRTLAPAKSAGIYTYSDEIILFALALWHHKPGNQAYLPYDSLKRLEKNMYVHTSRFQTLIKIGKAEVYQV